MCLPGYASYPRGPQQTFVKKIHAKELLILLQTRREVFLSKFKVSPVPSYSAPLPSLKFPGGRGELKKYQCASSHPPPSLPSLLCSGMPPRADDVPFRISSVRCSLEQWAPDPSIAAALLDLPAGMSQSNFKFTHD